MWILKKAAAVLFIVSLAPVLLRPVLASESLEHRTSGAWLMDAYGDSKTGEFESCSIRTESPNHVFLVVTLFKRGVWRMFLRTDKWNLDIGKTFIVTLNLDKGLKASEVFEAKATSDRFILLPLPSDKNLIEVLESARTARISRESKASYTFNLDGYAAGIVWAKACLKRYQNEQVASPDLKSNAEPENDGSIAPDDNGTIEIMPKTSPKSRQDQDPKPRPGIPLRVPSDSIRVEVPQPPQPQPAQSAVNAVLAALADVAKKVPQPGTVAQNTSIPTSGRGAAQQLLPNLMSAANRSDFRLVSDGDVPERLKRSDLVFSMPGLTGLVVASDLPTANAASNEVLAYDRIACGGAYTAVTSSSIDGRNDVVRAYSECQQDGKSMVAHYLTLSRKTGGFFVVGLTSDSATAADTVLAADNALFDAALKVSGKF